MKNFGIFLEVIIYNEILEIFEEVGKQIYREIEDKIKDIAKSVKEKSK